MTLRSLMPMVVLREIASYPDGITTHGLASFLVIPMCEMGRYVGRLRNRGFIVPIGKLPHVRRDRYLWGLTLEGFDVLSETEENNPPRSRIAGCGRLVA